VCIDNQERIRAVLDVAGAAERRPQVPACFNGRWHIDHVRVIRGIPYHHINSASYYWLGDKFCHERLPSELANPFPRWR